MIRRLTFKDSERFAFDPISTHSQLSSGISPQRTLDANAPEP
jgi:hypothetical protein